MYGGRRIHMADKLILDPQAIVDKEFDIDFKGYNPEQVDLLLDSVIKDYQTYQKYMTETSQPAGKTGF